jgi:hypothetical protein
MVTPIDHFPLIFVEGRRDKGASRVGKATERVSHASRASLLKSDLI